MFCFTKKTNYVIIERANICLGDSMKKQEEKIIEYERYEPNYKEGLTEEQVQKRISEGLLNTAFTPNGRSYWKIALKNTFTFFNIIYILITILLLSANVKTIMNYSFVLIITFNTLIGIIQEIKSKMTIDKLQILSTPTVTVIRDNETKEVKVGEIVLDDIMYLTPGREVTTDSILQFGDVEVNESQLTGESIAIRKSPGATLYSGSFIVSGNCYAKVERIGKDNEIEKLSTEAKTYKKPQSAILNSLNFLLRVIAFFLVSSGIIMFLQNFDFKALISDGFTQSVKENYHDAILSTSTALLGMIPSGLYLFTTMALALGAFRLSKKHTLVKDIYCIEMLARVDVLCLDKTGTITDGTMSVTRFVEYQKNGVFNVQEIIGSMNSALQETNSTQKALENYFGFSKKMKPVKTYPFSSDNKYSAVEFEIGTFILGAPEFVLKTNYDKYQEEINEYANQGLRVVALAHSTQPLKQGKIQRVPKLISLILIEDQIRKDAYDTISYFKENGVEVKVISGDNPVTVSEVAKRVGISNAEDYISLDGLTDNEVYQVANSYTVFGRVKPNQKKILVQALKDAKKTVAMTGDGVNDILALKEADCSIAMASGSDAVRRVAQLVLLDSSFASMPRVVGEGRRVINNVQQTASLFLVKTLFIIILALLTVFKFIGAHAPDGANTFPFMGSKQLFLIEFFAIGIPTFFLTLQPNENKIQGRFLYNVLKQALPGALAVALEVIISYSAAKRLGLDMDQLRTIVVLTATATCFMVLYMACRPFSWKKILMFFVCVSGAVFLAFASTFELKIFNIDFREQFGIFNLRIGEPDATIYNASGIFLAIILSMSSYVMITMFNYIIRFVETKIFVKKSKTKIKKR